MKKAISLSTLILVIIISSCRPNEEKYDATGIFEAEETIISSQSMGILQEFRMEEGDHLEIGEKIGLIDTTLLALKKNQLVAQSSAILSKRPNVVVQLSALQSQLSKAEYEKKRIENLLKGDAATPKQLDDINAQINLINDQISAQKSTLNIANAGITKESQALLTQLSILNEEIERCHIINPVKGTVLTKYAMAEEMMAPGKPLYKIADLGVLELRAYVSGNQLAQITLNQKVTVLTDDGNGGYNQSSGEIIWISNKAEFTPKTIQTKDERANRVYAIKIQVDNPKGLLKIGMYGEVMFK
ncbi:MAG: efflux RND transporter periplasmic adaptor subunit [Saprospiraceae bacterium]